MTISVKCSTDGQIFMKNEFMGSTKPPNICTYVRSCGSYHYFSYEDPGFGSVISHFLLVSVPMCLSPPELEHHPIVQTRVHHAIHRETPITSTSSLTDKLQKPNNNCTPSPNNNCRQ